MEIDNILMFNEHHKFQPASIVFSEKGIVDIAYGKKEITNAARLVKDTPGEIMPGFKYFAIPGLVDIHFHGCKGEDLSDAKPESISVLAEYEAQHGITSICPATMTLPVEELHQIMQNVGRYQERTDKAVARLAGINMEGPFISREKRGAQAAENIIPCSVELFCQLQQESGNRIKLVDIAPEEPGAMEFIRQLKNKVVISLAHTMTDYDTAMDAFQLGANHVTHLYNAMPSFNHRNPGLVGAAADSRAFVEMICDGVHVHPSMIRAMFKLIGSDKICLISDSLRATGLNDGRYPFGGHMFTLKGSLAIMDDGAIAGSVSNLMSIVKKLAKEFGVSLEQVVESASETPAKSIGIFDDCGSLEIGKRADLVLLDRQLNVKRVFVGGREVGL